MKKKIQFLMVIFLSVISYNIYSSEDNSSSYKQKCKNCYVVVNRTNFEQLKDRLHQIDLCIELRNTYFAGCEAQFKSEFLANYNIIRRALNLSPAEEFSKEQIDTEFLEELRSKLDVFEKK